MTDLYHPAQDPDDQFDLATVLALPELDLRAVILDTTEKFLRAAPEGWDVARDPGFVTVAQAGWLLGRAIPAAMGPTAALRDPADDARDRPQREHAGVELLLRALVEAPAPVVISVVGSARVVTAAFNRDPDLLRRQVRAVVINAGTTVHRDLEWNVQLDPAAFVGLWRSGLPVHWYPCATERGAFDRRPERGTHWRATHAVLLEGIAAPWRGWFAYGLTGSARGDVIGALASLGRGAVWENIQPASRSMWSTASLVMAAGRGLAKTPEGWRFCPLAQIADHGWESWDLRLDPITGEADDAGQVTWALAEADEAGCDRRLFGRTPGEGYGEAMAEALNALLRTLPGEPA
ncbi:hypothetical protein [Actomonas aquatica]|uniref:Inosine/uridine-preferring nucleoside hydrolase domain-containing protein n=1 Tax=Actomonas aquatica TaxID=2866162 RepID=A0ABZ1CG68_9BACT|nr:hypothetical protein [Opitutus sp. WL0086]WRQ89559.1 hypothetical protein K1X11_009075 [Opitutus sp. WL0086]